MKIVNGLPNVVSNVLLIIYVNDFSHTLYCLESFIHCHYYL